MVFDHHFLVDFWPPYCCLCRSQYSKRPTWMDHQCCKHFYIPTSYKSDFSTIQTRNGLFLSDEKWTTSHSVPIWPKNFLKIVNRFLSNRPNHGTLNRRGSNTNGMGFSKYYFGVELTGKLQWKFELDMLCPRSLPFGRVLPFITIENDNDNEQTNIFIK